MDPIHGYHQTWLGNSRSWRTMEVYFAKSFNDMGIFCPASHGNHIGWVYSWGYPLVNIHIAIFHISIASWFTQLFSLWWIFPVRKLSTLSVFHVPQLLDVDVTGTQLWLGARFAPSESSALHCFGSSFSTWTCHIWNTTNVIPQKGRKSWFTTISMGF